MGYPNGQRRALRIVDQNGAILNERLYTVGANDKELPKLRDELDRMLTQWIDTQALPAETSLRIVDVPAGSSLSRKAG